jgi:Flp pilus assembly protein TadB
MNGMAIGTLLAAFVAAAALARWLAVWRWQAARGFMEREAAAVDERMSDAFSDSLTGRGFVWLRYGGAVGAAVVTLALSDGSLVLALAVGAACYLAPGAILGLVQRRRRKRLEAQIPDLIATLSATIKAGFSLQRSCEDMAARMRPPICEELGLVVQRIHAGQTMEAALAA